VLTPLNGIAGIIAGAAQSIAAATINSNNAVALEGANGSNTTNVLLSEAINTLSVIAQKINQPPKGIDDNRSYVSSSGLPGYYDVFNMS
jgi:hypothetical protein